jgi:hypothetical protein
MGNERKNIMKRRIHDALLSIVGLAGVAFFALSGASCEKPTMQCAAGHGPFIAKYAVTSGDAACYPLPPDGGVAEEIGFATYLQSKPKTTAEIKDVIDDDHNPLTPAGNDDSDPSKPDRGGVTAVTSAGADYNTRKVALQSTTFGTLLQDRSGAGLKDTGAAYTFGDYTSNPDDNNVCYAFGNGEATTNVADLDVDAFDTGEVDPMTMMPIVLPAVHYRQEWKDVRLYVTEGVPGTQAVGEMTFDNLTPGAECSVTFKFVGLYPAAHCIADILVDHMCDDDEDPMTPDVFCEGVVVRSEPDNALCLAKAEEGWKKPPAGTEYKAARVFGSGINPDFTTKCDADLGYCVLTGSPLTGDP